MDHNQREMPSPLPQRKTPHPRLKVHTVGGCRVQKKKSPPPRRWSVVKHTLKEEFFEGAEGSFGKLTIKRTTLTKEYIERMFAPECLHTSPFYTCKSCGEQRVCDKCANEQAAQSPATSEAPSSDPFIKVENGKVFGEKFPSFDQTK